jgi:hypothetical protein
MRRAIVSLAGCGCILLAALLASALCEPAIAEGTNTSGPPALLTNLFQLRRCAGQERPVVHPFQIVADVFDVDSAGGVLVLRDDSGIELVQLDLRGQTIEPGIGFLWKEEDVA